VAVLGGMWALE